MDVRGSGCARLVVIGHGPAGHRLLEGLREGDTAGRRRITVIGAEPWPASDRVALTSCLTEDAEFGLAGHDPAVTPLTGDAVVAIDRAGRTVTTRAGTTVGHDALVLATGSAPFVPPVRSTRPWSAMSPPTPTSGGRPSRIRSDCAGSCPSSTPRETPGPEHHLRNGT